MVGNAVSVGLRRYHLSMRVSTLEQLLDTLDQLFGGGSDLTHRDNAEHWAGIFRRADHPLNTELPDAGLVAWSGRGLIPDGVGHTALDIGCGLGRNTRWLARQGYRATGIDISEYALQEARRRSAGLNLDFLECDVLREPVPGGPFDLVYDSGCFHHLAPHRRLSYLTALEGCLNPGGHFAICTFAPDEAGADDLTLLRQGRLEGGIGYSTQDLTGIFSELELLDSGPMSGFDPGNGAVFSKDFLNVALFRRPAEPGCSLQLKP